MIPACWVEDLQKKRIVMFKQLQQEQDYYQVVMKDINVGPISHLLCVTRCSGVAVRVLMSLVFFPRR